MKQLLEIHKIERVGKANTLIPVSSSYTCTVLPSGPLILARLYNYTSQRPKRVEMAVIKLIVAWERTGNDAGLYQHEQAQ